MNHGEPLSGEWLTAWERAVLIEETKEQEQFHDFYASIPELVVRHKTQESHLPLKFITEERKESRLCDDITFCPEQCEWKSCPRNKQNIRDRTIPHSFSVEIPNDCPKRQEGR